MKSRSSQRVRFWIDEIYAPKLSDQRLTLLLSGWATLPFLADPIRVELCCDGVTLEEVIADEVRSDVVRRYRTTQGKSGGPNERCGFHLSAELPHGARHLRLVAHTPRGQRKLLDTHVATFLGLNDEVADNSFFQANVRSVRQQLTRFAAALHSPAKWVRRGQRLGRVIGGILRAPPEDDLTEDPVARQTPYETYVRNNELTPRIRQLLTQVCQTFDYQPLISIVMPVYNVDPLWLGKAVRSVRDQIYPHWELLMADDASTRDDLREYLQEIQSDPRIQVIWREKNGNICEASNSAAELARGEFLVFMDNDDTLAPHALFEVVRLLQEHLKADVIYSDEDKIDENDCRYDPQFKPSWSPEMFLSYNYINHLVCLRRSLFEKIGRFRLGYEGAQDRDLLLRAVSETECIHHIPKVLYHWRALPSSTAHSAVVKPSMYSSSRAALEDFCRRQKINASIYEPEIARRLQLPIYQLDWPDTGPDVAILIPVNDLAEVLHTCIESLRGKTSYPNLRIIILDHGSADPAMLRYLDELHRAGIEVLSSSDEQQTVSRSCLVNRAVQQIQAELILLLNPAIEVVEPKWLSRMVGYLSLPGVGATGARLLCSDGTVQHAGMLLQMDHGIAPDHAFQNQPAADCSYYFQAEVARNCSAVTGSCLLTRRELFLQIGELDEQRYPAAFSDVDYCLRLLDHGWRVVYVAGAELLQRSCPTSSPRDHPDDLASFRKSHGQRHDPYYNPNLSRSQSHVLDPSCHLDYTGLWPRRVNALMVTHNLNLDGAPKALYEVATGLKTKGQIEPTILSPVDGPLQAWYDKAAVNVVVERLPGCDSVVAGWNSVEDYQASLRTVRHVLQRQKPDVIVVNTLHNFYVVKAAAELKLPVIWIIRESYSRDELPRRLDAFTRQDCYQAFSAAQCVVFVSTDTCDRYRHLHTKHNFVVLHNGIDATEIDAYVRDVTRAAARARIGSCQEKKIITTVGTICERKAQHLLVEAAARLRTRSDFSCYLVGQHPDLADHCLRKIHHLIERYQLQACVKVVPATPEVYDYYRASDVFVLCSQEEGYNRALLEAEAFGLPIVTTPCPGVNEQVRHRINALIYPMSDSGMLAGHLQQLLDDPDSRRRMGHASRQTFECLKSYPEMLAEYERIISRCALLERM